MPGATTNPAAWSNMAGRAEAAARIIVGLAPVAQLDRALPSGGRGQRFESSRARHHKEEGPSGALLLYGGVPRGPDSNLRSSRGPRSGPTRGTATGGAGPKGQATAGRAAILSGARPEYPRVRPREPPFESRPAQRADIAAQPTAAPVRRTEPPQAAKPSSRARSTNTPEPDSMPLRSSRGPRSQPDPLAFAGAKPCFAKPRLTLSGASAPTTPHKTTFDPTPPPGKH